jgi:hypothetical protein
MRIKPFFSSVDITLVGSFNPTIFQPAWFAANGMVGKRDAENAKTAIIHQHVSSITFDQFQLQVTQDRFAISTVEAYPDPIKDLVQNCFGEGLPHTPVRGMGINFTVHFDSGSYEARYKVGQRLAPVSAWGDWGRELAVALEAPRDERTKLPENRSGMMSLSMRQEPRPDTLKGYIQVRIEPSTQEPASGIFMAVNDHYQFDSEEGAVQNAIPAVRTLGLHWTKSLERSDWIIDQIMQLTEESRG